MDNQQPKIQNAQKYFYEIGKIYGHYQIIDVVKVQGRKSIETRYKVLNLDNNTELLKKGAELAKYKEYKTVDEINKELLDSNSHQMGFRNYLFRSAKTGARNRNHEWYLSQEEFMNIITQNCYYCGEKPRPASEELLSKRGNLKQPTFYYNGIDRIDSSKHYSIDNVVPCCPMCNYMKNTFSKQNFLYQIKKIYNHLNLGSTTIENTSKNDGSE